MDMKKINIGLIGIGGIGKTHLNNCMKIEDIKVVSVADTSKRALSNAKNIGIKNLHSNYEEMLKLDEIDGVIISLPNFLHKKAVNASAEANKHILVEKPLARNHNEGKEMINSVKKSGVKLMIGYPLRYSKNNFEFKENIEMGLYGDIQGTHGVYVGPGPYRHRNEEGHPVRVPEWWFNKELTGGGVVRDLGSHLINLMRWMLGDISKVNGFLGYRYNLENEDHASVSLLFNNRITGTLNLGWFSQKEIIKIDVYGTVENDFLENKSPGRIKSGLKRLFYGASSFDQPYMNEISHFANCIYEDLIPNTTGEDALKDIEIIDMIYKNSV
jgi:predicted dehydrogenase